MAISYEVDWAEAWKDGLCADLTLELTVKDHPDGTQYKNVHRLLLNAKSAYFQNRLFTQHELVDHGPIDVESSTSEAQRAKRQKVAEAIPAGRTKHPSLLLTVECESTEGQTACLAVLKHACTGELPAAADNINLVAMVSIKADYFQMPATVEASLAALGKLAAQAKPEHSHELNGQLVALLDVLPEQLLANSDSGKALLKQLRALATRKYMNALNIMNDKRLQQEFVALPFDLLLHWASLNELVTDSENTIAVLMHIWIKHNSLEQPASTRVTEQLSQLLRVGQLSFTFHLDALPKLPWYKAPAGLPEKHALVRWGYEKGKQGNRVAPEVAAAYSFTPKREIVDAVTIEWDLNTVQLQAHWASTEPFSIQGPSKYYAGYTCTVESVLKHQDNHKVVGIYLSCKYCPELSPECSGQSHAALNVRVEAGQGGNLHNIRTFDGVYHDKDWGLHDAFEHRLPVEGGLQELMTYKELPIKVTIKMC